MTASSSQRAKASRGRRWHGRPRSRRSFCWRPKVRAARVGWQGHPEEEPGLVLWLEGRTYILTTLRVSTLQHSSPTASLLFCSVLLLHHKLGMSPCAPQQMVGAQRVYGVPSGPSPLNLDEAGCVSGVRLSCLCPGDGIRGKGPRGPRAHSRICHLLGCEMWIH